MDRCLICMNIQPLVKIDVACSHLFCSSCITLWLEKHDTCPMCRCVVRAPVLTTVRTHRRKRRGNFFADDRNLLSIAMLAGAL